MRVLVYGATGTQGAPVARRLLERGDAVRVITLDPEAAQSWARAGAQVTRADLRDATGLAAAHDGVDAVFVQISASVPPALIPQMALAAMTAARDAQVRHVVMTRSHDRRRHLPRTRTRLGQHQRSNHPRSTRRHHHLHRPPPPGSSRRPALTRTHTTHAISLQPRTIEFTAAASLWWRSSRRAWTPEPSSGVCTCFFVVHECYSHGIVRTDVRRSLDVEDPCWLIGSGVSQRGSRVAPRSATRQVLGIRGPGTCTKGRSVARPLDPRAASNGPVGDVGRVWCGEASHPAGLWGSLQPSRLADQLLQ